MSLPTIKVLVGFQTTTGFGNPFQLDNTTFGLLNTGTLGGLAFADLTQYVEAVNIKRGRNRQLDQFNAGTAVVTFNNSSRILDPLNSGSVYYPYVTPRCPIIISADNTVIYSGFVTDWNLDYDISNQDMMYASCADAFTVLANQDLNEFTPSAEFSSARVSTILARPEIQYQGPNNITLGSSTLGAYQVSAGTNALTYLQTVAKSEQGYLYVAADGTLTFKGRTSVLNQPAGAAFADDGSGIPYQSLVNQYGDELLYNYIVTQSPAGAAQINSDATSIALYQSQVLSLTDLLNSTTTQVDALGEYLLGRYKDPVVRFTGVSIQLAALSTAHQTIITDLELTDVVSLKKSFVTGTPASVTQNLIVSGIDHDIRPGSHVVTINFESADQNQYLTLNDNVFGILDSNLLAF